MVKFMLCCTVLQYLLLRTCKHRLHTIFINAPLSRVSYPLYCEDVDTYHLADNSVVCSAIHACLCFTGGMQKGFCILILLELMNIFLYGMRILE